MRSLRLRFCSRQDSPTFRRTGARKEPWWAYFVFGPWSERGFPLTPPFPDSANLPRLADFAERWPMFAGMTAHAGALIAIAATIGTWWLIAGSRWGFEVRVSGENPKAAQLAGMNLARNTILVMAVSGSLCGLAGMSEVSGVVHRLQDRFSPGYGFTGIIVAWLGVEDLPLFRNPNLGYFLSMLPYLFVIAAMVVSARGAMRRRLGAPAALGLPWIRGERTR